jgi:hypothetical protein
MPAYIPGQPGLLFHQFLNPVLGKYPMAGLISFHDLGRRLPLGYSDNANIFRDFGF